MDHPAHTYVRRPRGVRAALLLGYPAAGALVGAAGGLVTEWVAHVSTTFDGILGFANHVGEPVGLLVATGLGLVAGLVVAVAVDHAALRVQVGARRITLAWDDARVSVPRSLIREIIVAHDVVLLGDRTVELARVRCDVDRPALRRALETHGYPAPLATDPYESEFRATWSLCPRPVPERGPGEDVQRLLDAREAALTNRSHGDAELLRRELAARGIMARHHRRRGRWVQQWRPLLPHLAGRSPAAEEPAELTAGPFIVPAA